MAKKVSNEEFNQIQAEDRQEKLLAVLTELVGVLKDKSAESEARSAADKASKAVDKLLADLKTTPAKSDVVSSERIEKLTDKLTRQLTSLQESLQGKPTEWDFEIVRDPFGIMTNVKVKSK